MEKMSDVLRDFAQPLLDLAKNEEQTRRALCTAVIAWNLACLPEEERLKKLNGRVSRELGEDGVFAVSYLIERKLALYPHIHRPILDFEMTMIENGPPHLAVISEPEPGNSGTLKTPPLLIAPPYPVAPMRAREKNRVPN